MTQSEDAAYNLALASLPKTALQAIYHAATGKTESMSKDISGNVLITAADIDRLYGMLVDQIDLHPKDFDPTVTIVIKHANNKSVTYSSWERFKVLRVNNHDVTSEIIIKIEFVIKLPNTPDVQRCVVNISIDSSLPMLQHNKKGATEAEIIGFLYYTNSVEWRTVTVAIDFVDFLVAKSFIALVEEWFSTLKRIPVSKLDRFLTKNVDNIKITLMQMARFGMAAFIASFALFSGSNISVYSAMLGSAVAMAILATLVIAEMILSRRLSKRVSYNVVPSIVLLSDGDESAYTEIKENKPSAILTVFHVLLSIIMAISLNVVASYVYAYMSG